MKKLPPIVIFIFATTIALGNTTVSTAAGPEGVGSKCAKESSVDSKQDPKFICTKMSGKLTWQISTKINQLNIWKDLQKIRSEKPEVNAALDVRYSPTVNMKLANSILNGVNQAAKLWQEQYLPSEALPTLFFTEKDRSWFINQLKSIGVYDNTKVAQFEDEVRRNKDRASWAGISGANGKIYMTFMIGTAKIKSDANDIQVAAHEYTHLAQFAIAKNSTEQLACWQIEGGAFFYGIYLGANNSKQLQDLVSARNTDRFFINFSGMTKQPLNSFESLLDQYHVNYDHQKCGPDGAYPVGSAGMEYLYMLKGHQGTMDLLKNISELGSFTEAIKLTFGKEWTVIRKEMANYIKLVVAQNNY